MFSSETGTQADVDDDEEDDDEADVEEEVADAEEEEEEDEETLEDAADDTETEDCGTETLVPAPVSWTCSPPCSARSSSSSLEYSTKEESPTAFAGLLLGECCSCCIGGLGHSS